MYENIQEAINFALSRSLLNDPVKENTAALWALVLKFGHFRFADLIGYWYPINR